jgi:hypothetical protein
MTPHAGSATDTRVPNFDASKSIAPVLGAYVVLYPRGPWLSRHSVD